MATLTADQQHALFDILTHHNTYAEIENFRYLSALENYGYPFSSKKDAKSSSPILQTLFTRFAIALPGLRDLSQSFWAERIEPLLRCLAEANLSQSYDKSAVGQRRTVTTAISALLEYVPRGMFGYVQRPKDPERKEYNLESPEDINEAFYNLLDQCVYGNAIEEIFEATARTDKLSEQSSLVQAAHEYILLNVASLMHYTLILSPKGSSLLSLAEGVHKLLPYMMIRQTLKVGNAATMLNGLLRIVLAKVSIGAVTNFFGLSKNANEGMNLVQQIISQVLGWDNRRLKSRLKEVEKSKNLPKAEQLKVLKDFTTMSQEQQDQIRAVSKSSGKTIASMILADAAKEPLTDDQQSVALEYLNLVLSIRDRDQLIASLCSHHPDLLTPAIKDIVSSYENIIRQVHQAADLSGGLYDAEMFINDLIKICNSNSDKVPSVQDFVVLLKRHQYGFHKFVHQVLKNGPQVSKVWKDYMIYMARQFHEDDANESQKSQRKIILESLTSTIESQPDTTKSAIKAELDAHAKYIAAISTATSKRLSDILASEPTVLERPKSSRSTKSKTSSRSSSRERSTLPGPGIFLSKWQDLIAATEITPSHDPEGDDDQNTRSGITPSVQQASLKSVENENEALVSSGEQNAASKAVLVPPEVSQDDELRDEKLSRKLTGDHSHGWCVQTIKILGPKFEEVLAAYTVSKQEADMK